MLISLTSEGDSLLFTGVINTNGGGFASCRSDKSVQRFFVPEGATQVVLSVRGDGLQYKLMLSDGSRGGPQSPTPTYQLDFTPADIPFEEVSLPLSSFLPSFGGRPSARPSSPLPPLRKKAVTTQGFMLSLKTSSGEPNTSYKEESFPFLLEVRHLRFE